MPKIEQSLCKAIEQWILKDVALVLSDGRDVVHTFRNATVPFFCQQLLL